MHGSKIDRNVSISVDKRKGLVGKEKNEAELKRCIRIM